MKRIALDRVQRTYSTLSTIPEVDSQSGLSGAVELEERFTRVLLIESLIGLAGLTLVILSVIGTLSAKSGSTALYVFGALVFSAPYLAALVIRFAVRPLNSDAKAFDSLVQLLAFLEQNPGRWRDPPFKRRLLRSLEESSRSIRRYFVHQLRTRDKTTRWTMKREGERVAEAVRELKWWVSFPNQTTPADLRERIGCAITYIAQGMWDKLDRSDPRYQRPLWVRILLSALVLLLGLAVGGGVAILIILAGRYHDKDSAKTLQGLLGSLGVAALTATVTFSLSTLRASGRPVSKKDD